MKLNTSKLLFAQKQLQGPVLIVPFEIEVQTTSLSVEKYCKENYPQLMTYAPLDVTQLAGLQRMKLYIKKSLGAQDIRDITKTLDSRGWFNNLPTENSSIFKLELNDYNCKMSSDIWPFLILRGKLTVYLDRLIDHYISKVMFMASKTTDHFIQETAILVLKNPLPSLLTYERSFDIQQILLEIIKKKCNTDTPLSEIIAKTVGLEDVCKFKKEITWFDEKSIKVVINDFASILSAKAKKNWVPLTFAGVIAYAKKKQTDKQQEILNQSINVFKKMLALTKEMNESETPFPFPEPTKKFYAHIEYLAFHSQDVQTSMEEIEKIIKNNNGKKVVRQKWSFWFVATISEMWEIFDSIYAKYPRCIPFGITNIEVPGVYDARLNKTYNITKDGKHYMSTFN